MRVIHVSSYACLAGQRASIELALVTFVDSAWKTLGRDRVPDESGVAITVIVSIQISFKFFRLVFLVNIAVLDLVNTSSVPDHPLASTLCANSFNITVIALLVKV